MDTAKKQLVGVIGAGSFGTAIADLLSDNADVLMFARQKEVVTKINEQHTNLEVSLKENVQATNKIAEIAQKCTVIFAVVPSSSFREMMKTLSPHLRPYHIIIHGTKGFDLTGHEFNTLDKSNSISRSDIHTMSEVILQESSVVRIGCLSGPNLSREILQGKPTATVVASRFREVIKISEQLLNSRRFHVFGSYDLLGAELSGALKNAIAIGSGILGGLDLGKNIQALLVTRGLAEMIYFGKAMGSESKAFLGVAGIGDLVATATSENSRNYSFGKRIAKGESTESILATMPELAEGVRSIKIMKHLAEHYKIRTPITQILYAVLFEGFNMERGIDFLMKYPYGVDVDFL